MFYLTLAVQVSFENPSYTVNEEDGTVEVCFTTSTGHPDRNIVVEVQVQEGVSPSCGDAPQASGGQFKNFVYIGLFDADYRWSTKSNVVLNKLTY